MKKQVQEFKVKLPLSKKTVKLRSMLVKEEKLISEIQEIGISTEQKLTNLCDLVDSCCTGVNSKDLSIYDFQFLLAEIRKRSYSEISSFNLTCPKTKEKIEINLILDSEIIKDKPKEKLIIKLPSAIMEFRRPNVSDILEIKTIPDTNDEFLYLMVSCLDKVETESEKIDLTLVSIEEKVSCLNYLQKKNYKEVKEFILGSFIEYVIPYTTSDGLDRTLEVKDFSNYLKFYLVTLT